jgi:hypothetical protein
MNSFTKQKLTELLLDAAKRKGRGNVANERKFLLTCISDFNYILPIKQESPDEPDEYRHFYQTPVEELPEPVSIQKYQRTFITGGNDKLTKLQNRTTAKEADIIKIGELISNALNKLSQTYINIDTENIKIESIDKLYDIELGKGSLRKGFIAMVLFNVLVRHGITLDKQSLVSLFPGFRVSDLAGAEKKIISF